MLLEALLWLGALTVALYASEKLVQYVSDLGHTIGLSPAELGLLVALGADAPEVSSSLLALTKGAGDVGLGVIVGSNIYNLAGLLGLTAVLGSGLHTGRGRLTPEAVVNMILSALLFLLVLQPNLHTFTGLALVILLVVYAVITIRGRTSTGGQVEEISQENPPPGRQRPLLVTLLYLAVSIGVIIAASDLLVGESLALGKALAVPQAVIGTFALAIATSLPNTWAAISLARRHMPAAAIAATFTSNSINAAVGAGFPAIFFHLQALPVTRTLDVPWLLLMTGVAVILLGTRHVLSRLEGALLIGLYAAFVIIRLVIV